MQLNINIKQGVGELHFGMPVEEVATLLGAADSVETIDNAADEPTTVMQYQALDMTLFFEGENPVLVCIDLCNEEATLLGQRLFEMDEAALVRLMAEAGYAEVEDDTEDWGERRVSFPQANVDLFYEEGELMSINLGA